MNAGRKIVFADFAGLTFILGWTVFIGWLLYKATEPEATFLMFFMG